MKSVVNWIPLRMRVRSTNTLPHLKGEPEPLEQEIKEILCSKHEDHFSNPLFEVVNKKKIPKTY